jgi:hypothetical protein
MYAVLSLASYHGIQTRITKQGLLFTVYLPIYLPMSYAEYLHTSLYFRICNILAAHLSMHLRCKMPLDNARNMGSHSIARTVCSIPGLSLVKTKLEDCLLASDSVCIANSGSRLLTIAQCPLILYYPALRNDDHAAAGILVQTISRFEHVKQYALSRRAIY